MIILEITLSYLAIILPLLLAVAYFTLYERHILAALQRRQGPNVVGYYGLFQPLTDGLKLFVKESVLPKSANTFIFLVSPIFTFGLARTGWIVFPLADGAFLVDFRLGLLFLFAISSLSVHSVIRAGWSSNSKYAFLGGLRSAAQMISYEVGLGSTLISLILIAGTANFSTIAEVQRNTVWLVGPLLPICIIFFVTSLAETNRHPFDLPEAETELVSGYNVEYSAIGFAQFFLAEYSNIILRSALSALFFLGGWDMGTLSIFKIPGTLIFSLKVRLFVTLFVLVRGTLPRYRYDQLMRLGWKVTLPIALAFIVVYSSILFSFNAFVEFSRLIMMSFHLFIDLGLLVAFIGAFGIFVNKRHILLSVLCIEMRFYGLNFFLVAVSVYLDDMLGEVFSLFVLTLAAAESALALALITAYFRVYGNILLQEK